MGPALEKHFGIHPWDLHRLSLAEIRVRLDALKDMAAERKHAERSRRRR